MKQESNLSNINIISKWFGGSPQNIRKTYQVKKPISYDVIDIGSYVLENNITKGELRIAVDAIIALRKLNGK